MTNILVYSYIENIPVSRETHNSRHQNSEKEYLQIKKTQFNPHNKQINS